MLKKYKWPIITKKINSLEIQKKIKNTTTYSSPFPLKNYTGKNVRD